MCWLLRRHLHTDSDGCVMLHHVAVKKPTVLQTALNILRHTVNDLLQWRRQLFYASALHARGRECVYVLQNDVFCFSFFFVFFSSTKTMTQPFSGTAERIFNSWNFHRTIGGKCSLKRRAAAWRKSSAVWRMANVDDCVIYDMTRSQSPEGATHGGCVIQQWAGELM